MRIALLLLGLLAAACRPGPPAIAFDMDECRFCRMIISDERYAAAATTAGGRTVRFDSIECLAGWVMAETESPRAVWVTDAARPGTLMPAAEASFRRDTVASSPMAGGWIAEANGRAGIGWDSLLVVVRAEGALPVPHGHPEE